MARWSDLPSELRIQVLKHCFEGQKIAHHFSFNGQDNKLYALRFVSKNFISKQEWSLALFSTSTMVLWHSRPSKIARIESNTTDCAMIRQMEISKKLWYYMRDEGPSDDLAMIISWFPRLQTLVLRHNIGLLLHLQANSALLLLIAEHVKALEKDSTRFEDAVSASNLSSEYNVEQARAAVQASLYNDQQGPRAAHYTSANNLLLDWVQPTPWEMEKRKFLWHQTKKALDWQISMCLQSLRPEFKVDVQIELDLMTFFGTGVTIIVCSEHVSTFVPITTLQVRIHANGRT